MNRRILILAVSIALSLLVLMGLIATGNMEVPSSGAGRPTAPMNSSTPPAPEIPGMPRMLYGTYSRNFKGVVKQGESFDFELVTHACYLPSETIEFSPLVLISRMQDEFPFEANLSPAIAAEVGESTTVEARTGSSDDSLIRVEIRPSPRFALHELEERTLSVTIMVGKDVEPGRYRLNIVMLGALEGGGILGDAYEFEIVAGG